MTKAVTKTDWRIELPHSTAAVPVARSAVLAALRELGTAECPEFADTAELLTAELVANAVEHTTGDHAIALALQPLADGIRIEVHDRSAQDPPHELLREPPEPGSYDEGGRGLLLVRTLATASGCRTTTEGKVVWVTLSPVG